MQGRCKIIYSKYNLVALVLFFAFATNVCVAGELEESLASIAATGNARNIVNGNECDITNKSAELKPVGNADMDAQLAQIEANYKAQIDATTLTGRHDPLKSGLSNFNPNHGNASIAQDIRKITDKSSTERAKFKISKNDKLLMVAQDIESKTNIVKGDIVTPESMVSESVPIKDKIVTCREAGEEIIKKCYRTLVVTAHQSEDIKFTVELNFMAHSYSGHHTTVDLKNGNISASAASNSRIVNSFASISQGAQILSIKNLKSQSQGHTQDVKYSVQQPTAANNFIYSCNINQDNVGSRVKSRHRHNRNQNRGRIETWEVVARPAPTLVESWDEGDCAKYEKDKQGLLCVGPIKNLLEVDVSKSIPGYPAPVTRPHWIEEYIYSCGGGSDLNECESLRAAGCTQIKSERIKNSGSYNVEYLQTFNCGNSSINSNIKFDGTRMSLSAEQNIGANDGFEVEDFGNAVAQLSMVEELRKNIVREGDGNVLLFKGDRLTCDKFIASDIKNCCNFKGVLKNIIGHECSKETKEILAPAVVRDRRCVQVGGSGAKGGWYRVSKGVKRKSFCCYQSRLARIFQQIAHHQLGISWGTPEQPNCGPLDPSTFGRLNFDDPFARNLLKELVEEASVNAQKYANNANAKLANSADLSEKVKSLQDRIGAYYERNTVGAEPKP